MRTGSLRSAAPDPPGKAESQQAPEEQLPGTSGQQIKCRRGLVHHSPGRECERCARQDDECGGHQVRPPPQRQENDRIDEIELRFDGQRPGVEKGLQGQVIGVEIIHRNAGEKDVRPEEHRGRDAFGEKPHVLGKKDEEARQTAGQEDNGENRNDATDTTLVKRHQGKAAVFEFIPRNGGDQES